VTRRSGRGTARQTIRIEEDLWARFAAACEQTGTDRSTAIREFVAWYVREPGTKLPKRPAGE
jgi:antitoxin component of RelBE/YafQ-DinJ toxin-antitoxin module